MAVANAFYRGQRDLVVLRIDADRLRSPVRFEAPAPPSSEVGMVPNAESFPHVYGPIDVEAVVEVIELPADDDGAFTAPPALRNA